VLEGTGSLRRLGVALSIAGTARAGARFNLPTARPANSQRLEPAFECTQADQHPATGGRPPTSCARRDRLQDRERKGLATRTPIAREEERARKDGWLESSAERVDRSDVGVQQQGPEFVGPPRKSRPRRLARENPTTAIREPKGEGSYARVRSRDRTEEQPLRLEKAEDIGMGFCQDPRPTHVERESLEVRSMRGQIP